LKGKLALVKQGPCTITEQANRVAEAGAIGLIYFDSEVLDIIRPPYFNLSIPVATLSAMGGNHLISLLKNSNVDKFHMHFERNAFSFRSATANTIAEFSSIGPTNELDMKPSFAAIGSNVYSTLPQYLGGWGQKSGTSMACPYVAGTIGLLREAFAGKSIPLSTIHEKLQNYGKILKAYKKKDEFDSPLRQGAGLIQGEIVIMLYV
jgi:subtilisin family serine protease